MKPAPSHQPEDTSRSRTAVVILYVLLAAVTVFLCRTWFTCPIELGEDRMRAIKDISAQPYYAGKPLDYWLLANEADKRADRALEALGSVAVADLLRDLKGTRKLPAALALMRMGPAAHHAVPELVRVLEAMPRDRLTTELAVIILGYVGSAAEPALPALLALARTDKGEFCRPVIHTLGCIGAPARPAIPLLYEALNVSDDYTRTKAAEALWRIERQWEPLLPTLVAMRDLGNVAAGELARSLLDEIETERALRTATRRTEPRLSQGAQSSIHN